MEGQTQQFKYKSGVSFENLNLIVRGGGCAGDKGPSNEPKSDYCFNRVDPDPNPKPFNPVRCEPNHILRRSELVEERMSPS